MKLRIANVIDESIVDGPGLRRVLFTQGCPHACPGCHNPSTWSFDTGTWVDTDKMIDYLLQAPDKKVTFSGGEPFVQTEALAIIAKALRTQGFNLWSYTGFTWEALRRRTSPGTQELLNQLDVVVDGRFVLAQRSLSLLYKGSANQRLIDVQASLASNEVILWQPERQPEMSIPRTKGIYI